MREVEEETGLVIRPLALTGVYKNMSGGIVALVFRSGIVGGQERVGREACELRWLSTDELDALMTEAYAVRLRDALNVRVPAVRAHDGINVLATSRRFEWLAGGL